MCKWALGEYWHWSVDIYYPGYHKQVAIWVYIFFYACKAEKFGPGYGGCNAQERTASGRRYGMAKKDGSVILNSLLFQP